MRLKQPDFFFIFNEVAYFRKKIKIYEVNSVYCTSVSAFMQQTLWPVTIQIDFSRFFRSPCREDWHSKSFSLTVNFYVKKARPVYLSFITKHVTRSNTHQTHRNLTARVALCEGIVMFCLELRQSALLLRISKARSFGI